MELFFQVLEVAQMREDAVFSVGSDGAGVYEDGVGEGGFIGRLEAGGCERRGDQRRIQLVHLTAKTLYVDFFCGHGNGALYVFGAGKSRRM